MTDRSQTGRRRVIRPHVKRRTVGGRPFVSLRVKFAIVLVTSGLITLSSALILIPVAENIVTTMYMSPENTKDRLDAYISDFAEYVSDEAVRSDDTTAVLDWTRRHRYVHLVVFAGDKAQFGVVDGELLEGDAPPSIDHGFTEIPVDGDGQSADLTGNTYAVAFANGVSSVALVDYSQSMVYDAVMLVGVIVAISVFFVVMLLYYQRQTRAILTLSAEVEMVSNGALYADIRAERNDEIGQLAQDVDVMRTTILEKMEERQRAWDANSDLITSMSHDIRTPLTALLGYMELLRGDTSNMSPEQQEYIRICAGKAEQIKGLSDKLFLYFWAFNQSETQIETETYEASLLFEQMLGEQFIWLESEGFEVRTQMSIVPPELRVRVNADCLRRVIDNVCDNIRKYADRTRPVTVTVTCEDGWLKTTFENEIGRRLEKTSGTHIGLKTCTNMMALMHGVFTAERRDNCFVTVFSLPTEEEGAAPRLNASDRKEM